MTFKDHLEEFMEDWLKKKKKPVGTRILQHYIDSSKAAPLSNGIPSGKALSDLVEFHRIPHIIHTDLYMKPAGIFHEN